MRTTAIVLLAMLGAGALAACDGEVVSQGATTTSSTTTTSTTTTVNPACVEGHEAFEMRLATPAGAVWSCAEGQSSEQGDLAFSAAVVGVSGNTLTLDACSPAADCMPMLHTLEFSAPGLTSYIPVGAYVEVSVHVAAPWGCEHSLQIRNLPSWDGYPNSAYQDDRVWVVASDGSTYTFADTPFTIEREQLGCPGEPYGCGPLPVDTYALVFGLGAGNHTLQQGEGTTVALPTATPQYLDLHNLRSYQPALCDDDWNWGYFAVRNLGVD